MAYINFQPNPKIPPIGFFSPISVDPKDMMTDVEFLLGMLKKLNEVIAQTNSNTEFINNYAGKVEEIEAEMAELQQEMAEFKNEINQDIALRFAEIKLELQTMISVAFNEAKAYTDSQVAMLEQEIAEISIGQISLFDPTTGLYSPLQVVVDNLYTLGRTDALTATEYDTLDDGEPLTATAYDAYELSAYQYDNNAKSLLV
jgi:hypothetical protein